MPFYICALAMGAFFLIKGADHLVNGASRLSSLLALSPIVVGAVIMGFGTSAPEIFVSGLASWRGEIDIAVGNVIGSNVTNLTLVMGIVAAVHPLEVSPSALRWEIPFATFAVLIYALVLFWSVSLLTGLILLAFLGVLLVYIVRGGRTLEGATGLEAGVRNLEKNRQLGEVSLEMLRMFFGLVATLTGAWVLIWGALGISEEMSLKQGLVGFTLVALGTSLPELATSIVAVRRGQVDLILGNLFGSNVFNSFAVGGITAVVSTGPAVDMVFAKTGGVVMAIIGVFVLVLLRSRRKVGRSEGLLLLSVYLLTLPFFL